MHSGNVLKLRSLNLTDEDKTLKVVFLENESAISIWKEIGGI